LVFLGALIGVVRGINFVVRRINQEKVTHHKHNNVTICHILVLNPKNLMQSKRTALSN
jgi:hypothetical protein